jgi:putative transcriptional regulator
MSAAAEFQRLTDHFLIAMPGLCDPIFTRSLTYICEHNASGAMGIVVNHPLDLCWREVFQQLELEGDCNGDEPVLAGGPVHMDRGFILHPTGNKHWESSLTITPSIELTTSMDIITALAEGTGPARSLMALGYAGWGQGQLEDELAQNFWLTLEADHQILFDIALEHKAGRAASKLGINLDLLSSDAGHA